MSKPEFGEIFEVNDLKAENKKLEEIDTKHHEKILPIVKEKMEIERETIMDVMGLIIEKARNFPEYPIAELKKEGMEWVRMYLC